MTDDQNLHSKMLRLGGITALLSGLLFFVGVVLQVSSGWFPEKALGAQEMTAWLSAVTYARGTALAGVGFSLVAIALWMLLGLVLYRLLRMARPM
ncbi:MAG: hypothetical protein HKN13_13280, partial [Rhodothermales bacterium]|nr:hypothetical protein [Rhodothermales bacterium]